MSREAAGAAHGFGFGYKCMKLQPGLALLQVQHFLKGTATVVALFQWFVPTCRRLEAGNLRK